MRSIALIVLLLITAVAVSGCCGGVPKANLYWPITFGMDNVQPTAPAPNVPMVPAYQTPQYQQTYQAPQYAAPCAPPPPVAANPCR